MRPVEKVLLTLIAAINHLLSFTEINYESGGMEGEDSLSHSLLWTEPLADSAAVGGLTTQ